MRRLKKDKKVISKLIAGISIIGLMINPLVAYAGMIKDIDNSSGYAKAAITSLAERNIISGDNNGNFFPKQIVTRERLVTMMVRAMNIDTSNIRVNPTFKDVPADHWAYKYIEAAFREGLIQGVSKDSFGINQPCTREQMAAIIVRSSSLNKDMVQENWSFDNIRNYQDFDNISEWAKGFVDSAVKHQLMNRTGSLSFSPKEGATMEQSAVVIDRLITDVNSDSAKDGIEITLNGDSINIDSPVVVNGETLVPIDFLRYFTTEYNYNKEKRLVYVHVFAIGPPGYSAEAYAKIDRNEAYVFHGKSVNEVPYDNENAYAQYKEAYSTSPKVIDSKVYLPAAFVADVAGAEFILDTSKNTLLWTDDKVSKYPTLLEAIKKRMYLNKDEFEYNMKASFNEKLYGYQINYDFQTTGQFDFSNGYDGTVSRYHLITDNKATSNLNNGSYGWLEKLETVKVGSDLYTKNEKTGQYELTSEYGSGQRAADYTFVSKSNSALWDYFIRYKVFEVYNNVDLDGQKTTKYVLRLSDVKEIDHFFGFTYTGTVNGETLEFKGYKPTPFPDYYDSFFFGEYSSRSVNTDFGQPRYKDYSAKIDIYVNKQNEIVKEVLYNSGNRYHYAEIGIDNRHEYRDIDYSFVYDIEFKPFSGTINPPN